jgi:hypothetical protein
MKPVAPRPARLLRRHAVAAGVINDPRVLVEFGPGRERLLACAMLFHPDFKFILAQPAKLGCSRPNGKQDFYFPDYLVEWMTERLPVLWEANPLSSEPHRLRGPCLPRRD